MRKLKWWQFFISPIRFIQEWRAERAEKAAAKALSVNTMKHDSSELSTKAAEKTSYGSTINAPAAPLTDSSEEFLLNKPTVARSKEVSDLAHELRNDLVDYVQSTLIKIILDPPKDVETLANEYAALKFSSNELKGLHFGKKMAISRIATLLTELNKIINGKKQCTIEELETLMKDKSKDLETGNDQKYKDSVNDPAFKAIIDKHLKRIDPKDEVSQIPASSFGPR